MAALTSSARRSCETEVASEAERRLVDSSVGRPRLEGLTTLRFFAALHVILFHLRVEGILTEAPGGIRTLPESAISG